MSVFRIIWSKLRPKYTTVKLSLEMLCDYFGEMTVRITDNKTASTLYLDICNTGIKKASPSIMSI